MTVCDILQERELKKGKAVHSDFNTCVGEHLNQL